MGGFQVMPRLSPEEYTELEQSIVDHGVQVPITVAADGTIVDGHHRDEIARKHDLHCPRRTTEGSTAELRNLAFSLNLHRRHLTREQKRQIVAESIKADPQLSDREHGRRTGVSKNTAAAVRDELEAGGQVDHLDYRENPQGRPQPATKPRPVPVPDWIGEAEEPESESYGVYPPWPRPDEADMDSWAFSPDDDVESTPAAPTPAPAPAEPAKPRRRPITEAFDTATYNLKRAVETVARLAGDDRLEKNKDQIRASNLSDLIRVRDAINGIINALEG